MQIYILYSEVRSKSYVGHSDDLQRRLKEHNEGKVESTRYEIPWQIIWIEECKDREEALKREKYYKTGAGRRKIKNIIQTKKSQVRPPRLANRRDGLASLRRAELGGAGILSPRRRNRLRLRLRSRKAGQFRLNAVKALYSVALRHENKKSRTGLSVRDFFNPTKIFKSR